MYGYCIIQSDSIESLQEAVNKEIKGKYPTFYKLIGGPFQIDNTEYENYEYNRWVTYGQAIVFH